MESKTLLLQFFHERAYRPQPLTDFEEEARRAAALGAKYVFIGEIPKNHADWDAHPGDPYPNWGMLLTNLFKIIVPKALEDALDTAQAERNLTLLRQRAEILRRYHLRAALTLSEPFYLPEEVYRAHPAWRGPRCDHPRRSREMYFSPCIDEPEVLALYAEAMDRLCEAIDIGYLQIITNDSGAGLCWSSGLYNGPNGPAGCRNIPLGQRLLKFLGVFQDAAAQHGREMIADITSHIIGFKEKDDAMEGVWRHILPGQIVNGRDARGNMPLTHVTFGLYEHYRPLRCLPAPVDFLDAFDRAMRAPGKAVMVNVRESEFGEYDKIMRAYLESMPQNAADRMALLLRVSGEIAGETQAGALLDAWLEIDQALRLLKGIWLDNFVMMPLVSQRLLVRPFVPQPALLTEAETAYYRPFLFQATTEQQAQDLMNIQGMDFIRGFSGTRMATLAMRDALGHMARACEKVAQCGEEKFSMLLRRLQVMQCMIHTLDHACRYQEILDRTQADEAAPLGTEWPRQGDDRILKLGEIARAEIDNCYALAALIEGHETALFNLTGQAENEDIFVMSTALPAQLRRKAEIMLNHMRDADAIYETNNK